MHESSIYTHSIGRLIDGVKVGEHQTYIILTSDVFLHQNELNLFYSKILDAELLNNCYCSLL